MKVSVRNLVEFLLRSGDITTGGQLLRDKEAMLKGSKIHRKIQRQMDHTYQAEVSLRFETETQYENLVIEGRADGIFLKKNQVYIDEIKGVRKNIWNMEEPVFLHEAQAMCYASMYCEDKEIEKIGIQMTYCHLESEEIRRFEKIYEVSYLKEWFLSLVNQYKKWTDFQCLARIKRDESIEKLTFPFPYRKGQKEMIACVYRAIDRSEKLFVQAPTGIGKTISTIYPSIWALKKNKARRFFYLTAKTVTISVALQTIRLLEEQGLALKTIQITAKDKLCACEERVCDSEVCERAKGHYDRINDAIYDLVTQENLIDRETIILYAKKHMVCPFELCLDARLVMDAILCDYNYVFDLTVKLKRFFAEAKKENIFLIDECHNLVERARSMYSASLSKEDFLIMKKIFAPLDRKLVSSCENVNKKMLAYKKQTEDTKVFQNVDDLSYALLSLSAKIEAYLEDHIVTEHRQEILDFYFEIRQFLTVYELLDECYVIYGEKEGKTGFFIKLFCVCPDSNLLPCYEAAVSTIFFSATLLPIEYYRKLLCGTQKIDSIYLDSPFSQEKRLLAIANDISTKYSRRGEKEYKKIANYLYRVTTCKKGNYLVFFPSYAMMYEVYDQTMELGIENGRKILVQKSQMTEAEKEKFLSEFEDRNKAVIGFCVMGGVFSEGIDLKNEALIGVIVVGTGLPMVCPEREYIKKYFERAGLNGFSYAYLYPGMNKVTQAAGRVIRTAQDVGVILLLDERFLQYSYQSIFPREWEQYYEINTQQISALLTHFWKETDGIMPDEDA